MDSWEGHWQRFLYGTYYSKNKGRVDSGFPGYNVGNWGNTAVDVQFGQHMDHIPDIFEYTITGPGTYTIAMTGTNHYPGTVTKTFTVLTDAFADVNIKTPHTEDITWMYLNKISEGRLEKDGIRTYRPMNSVVRQDMAAFLHRLAKAAGIDATDAKEFTDVNKSTLHAEDISWLGGTGISTGYADGTYQGMWPVYNQDMAAFLRRLQAMKNPDAQSPSSGNRSAWF